MTCPGPHGQEVERWDWNARSLVFKHRAVLRPWGTVGAVPSSSGRAVGEGGSSSKGAAWAGCCACFLVVTELEEYHSPQSFFDRVIK